MDKQNKNRPPALTDLIHQYQTDLSSLSSDLTIHSRIIIDLRSKLQTLTNNLNMKAEETQYSNKIDLEKLSDEIMSKCRAELSYSGNVKSQIGRLQTQNQQAKVKLNKIEGWVKRLAEVVG